ncbi:MAG TPA: alpha/beta hydrolase [Propionibacteriaceae bacterium]|nr:alpha/beta hydrolase [Propionibacteriaceae bacterium]
MVITSGEHSHTSPKSEGDVEIAYETFGNPADPPVLLIMGLGAQLLTWPEDFCQQLADRSLFVVRFDNRDVGLSTHLHHLPLPDFVAIQNGDFATVPYTLNDMAADTANLIDDLDLGSVHVVGASMGGMIGQILTIEHPHRVRSLTSIMSTTGDRSVGESTEEALAHLIQPAARTREELIDRRLLAQGITGSPDYPTSEAELRDRAGQAFDRNFDPAGGARQFAATLAAPDRTAGLAEVRVPTLVIHGAEDPLIQVSGGHATAAAIPGAELWVIDGMGHDLPRELWPQLVERISTHIESAERTRTSS